VVRALDQKMSQVSVAGLGDAKLWVAITGLTSSGSQAEITADVTTSSKPLLVAESENEGERGDVTHTLHLQQRLRLGILRLRQ